MKQQLIQPHSDSERIALIETSRYEIQQLPDVGFYAIDLSSNLDVFTGEVFFDTWRSAVDALLDLINQK